jgi:Secretion system C-terminal sorting domain
MKDINFRFLVFVLLCVSQKFAFSQKKLIVDWQKTAGGERNEVAYAGVETKDGGYIIVGSTNSKNSFDVKESNGYNTNGGNDFWVTKISAKGATEWAKAFGGTKDDIATSIAKTANNEYLILGSTLSIDGDAANNGTNGGLLLLRITETGGLIYKKILAGGNASAGFTYSPANTFSKPVVKILDDQKIVIGASRASAVIPATLFDFYIGVFTPTADPLWSNTYGGKQEDYLFDFIKTADGGYALCGGTMSFGDDFPGAGQGFVDMAIVKIDANGKFLWKKAWGGKSFDMLYSLTEIAATKMIYAVGESSSIEGPLGTNKGNKDGILMKIDNSGIVQSIKHFGGIEDDGFFHILAHTDGNLYLSGATNSNIDTFIPKSALADAWLLSLKESTLETNYQFLLGGADADQFRQTIIPSTKKGLSLIGNARSTDGDITLNRGQTDFWLVSMTPPPPALFSRFEAYLTAEQKVEVTWTTIQEENVALFIIEKSTDNINWKVLGEIPASGTSYALKNYRLIDLNSKVGKNYYKITYKDIKDVVYLGKSTSYTFIPLGNPPSPRKNVAFPNPSKGIFWIETPAEKYSIKIVNISGMPIEFSEIESENNVSEIHFPEGMASGIYFLQIISENGIESHKILVSGN